MSSPPSRIRPASGRSKPAISRSVVVLPEPDGPSSVKNSPSPTRRSTLCTATTSSYAFRIPSTATSESKALLQDVQSAREVLVRDRERDEDADHVSVEAAREEDEPALARLARDAGRLVARLLREFEREHRAQAAHLTAVRRHRLEPRAYAPRDLLRTSPRPLDHFEDRERRYAGDRVAAERPAEPARLDRVHHLGAPRDRCERQSAAECLPGGEQGRLHPVMLDRPHGAGPPAPGLHLVVDVEDPIRVEEFLQPLGEVVRHRNESALALPRLEHRARDRLRVDLALEKPLQGREGVVLGDAAERIR